MLAQIFVFVILSFILVVMYGIKFKPHRSNTAFYFLFILVSVTPQDFCIK